MVSNKIIRIANSILINKKDREKKISKIIRQFVTGDIFIPTFQNGHEIIIQIVAINTDNWGVTYFDDINSLNKTELSLKEIEESIKDCSVYSGYVWKIYTKYCEPQYRVDNFLNPEIAAKKLEQQCKKAELLLKDEDNIPIKAEDIDYWLFHNGIKKIARKNHLKLADLKGISLRNPTKITKIIPENKEPTILALPIVGKVVREFKTADELERAGFDYLKVIECIKCDNKIYKDYHWRIVEK